MSFARIIYTLALDLIGTRIGAGESSPTDEEFARHCGLDDTAPVRSLLADLADRGDITMRGTGGNRVILLGRQRSTPVAATRPIPSVRKPAPTDDAVIEAGLAKIKAALARGKGAVGPGIITSPPRPELTGEEPGTTDTTERLRVTPTPEGRADTSEQASDRQVGESPAVKPAPHPVMAELAAIPPEVVAELSKPALEMVRMPTTQRPVRGRPTVAEPARQTRKQVNVNLSAEQFAQLDRLATEQDLQTSSLARMLLAGALERPRIPARVATAAMRAGVPVLAFAATLMEIGLAEHLRGPAAQEHA